MAGFMGGLQGNLTKLMVSYQQNDLNLTKDAIIGINQFIEAVFTKDGDDCKDLQHHDDVSLKSAITVNGTQLQFLNIHGRQVDMTSTARLMARFYQDYTKLQAFGNLTTQNPLLSQIGMQLGMTNVLIARTGAPELEETKTLTPAWIALICVSSLLMIMVMATVFYKFYKRSKINQGGSEQESKDQEGLVATINNDETRDEQQ
jgi:hypothetical protein